MRVGDPNGKKVLTERTGRWRRFVRAGAAPLAGLRGAPLAGSCAGTVSVTRKRGCSRTLSSHEPRPSRATEGGTNPSCTVVESHERDVLT